MAICLERGAGLHMAQLMPLPLTVSCSSKNPDWFLPSWYRLIWVVPEKGPLNVCVCVCYYYYNYYYSLQCFECLQCYYAFSALNAFSALTLLVGGVLAWLPAWSEVQTCT